MTNLTNVTIVSANAETLEQLRAYFDGAGVPAVGAGTLAALAKLAPTVTAVVLFPDDFAPDAVASLVGDLQRSRPAVLLVVVTREPARFEQPRHAPAGVAPVVLPKPSFGWSILDAIRAHGPAPAAKGP